MSGAAIDEHGLETSGGAEAVAHFDRAVDELVHFRGGCLESASAALEADPTFAMGHALNAYLRLLTTEVGDFDEARTAFGSYRQGRTASALPREEAHLAAIDAWLQGDMTHAGTILRQVTEEYPRDLLALIVGHQIDFFTGDALALRDRAGTALKAFAGEDRHRGPVLGMYAFGLEEAGQYEHSEETGRTAVELDPADVWGIHAVAHTYEMQGRYEAGIGYFDKRVDAWAAPDNFFSPHNWWHYCLYALEAGRPEQALEIYDRELHNEEVELVAMQMLDASALLWRFYLEGADESARFRALVAPWEAKMARPFYAFNDFHAVMTYIGAGEIAKAEALIDERRRWVLSGSGTETNLRMTARLGIPVCEALVAFGRGNYGRAVDLLAPLRLDFQSLGGSHAQRDALQRTLVEAALRARRTELAERLIGERLLMRPSSPYNLLKRAQLADQLAGERAV
jgi:tetratricopeptide (TPR) repeat protein